MRELLFKNLTSLDKKKRVIASLEVSDKEGVHSVIRRHFACIIKEQKQRMDKPPLPYLYILKERDTLKQKEKFFCRIKGSVYMVFENKLFLVLFMHSLMIELNPAKDNLISHN